MYLDKENSVFAGVCAGVATTMGYSRFAVRLAVVLFGTLFPLATIVAYVIAALVLPARRLY